MINAEQIKLSNPKWPDILCQVCKSVGFSDLNQSVVIELKDRLSSEIEQIIVEFPYRDFDFSSTYSLFYTKKHRRVSRVNIPLMIWIILLSLFMKKCI